MSLLHSHFVYTQKMLNQDNEFVHYYAMFHYKCNKNTIKTCSRVPVIKGSVKTRNDDVVT